jgi:hypothetical protein
MLFGLRTVKSQEQSYKIVVAKYQENIDWSAFICSDKLVIYDKSDNPLAGSIHRKNIGRESDTFIQYILDNYHNLPEYIIFLQGNPFDHFPTKNITPKNLETNIENLITQNIDTMPLFNELHRESVEACKGMNIAKYYKLLFKDPLPQTIDFSPGCQYIIPRHKILQHSKLFYEKLSSMILKCTFTFHDVHYTTVNFDENVMDPWTFERLAFKIWS